MKFSISNNKIRLEKKVIDLSRFEIRPKATEQDLEGYYDCFISHAGEISDYFEDRNAFDAALKDAASDKRPKLVPRDTKCPWFWVLRTEFTPFGFLKPSKRRLHDKYFIAPHCIAKIPSKKRNSSEERPLDEKLGEDILEKFKQYPEYEGIIEIPNDCTQPQTKSSTFHESLHYLMLRYQAGTGRNFVSAFIKEDLSQIEKYRAEYMIHEGVIDILTDRLLVHDPDALFENRWLAYSLDDGFGHLVMSSSALATGLIIGTSIFNPYLLPLAIVPGRARDYAMNRRKSSKREELLKPIEYPKFKI